MAALHPVSDDSIEEVRDAFQNLRQRVGLVPNMYQTLAHAPRVLQAVLSMGQAIRTELEPKLRELAYLKVAQVHDCHY